VFEVVLHGRRIARSRSLKLGKRGLVSGKIDLRFYVRERWMDVRGRGFGHLVSPFGFYALIAQ
jgi:hypothetical protein